MSLTRPAALLMMLTAAGCSPVRPGAASPEPAQPPPAPVESPGAVTEPIDAYAGSPDRPAIYLAPASVPPPLQRLSEPRDSPFGAPSPAPPAPVPTAPPPSLDPAEPVQAAAPLALIPSRVPPAPYPPPATPHVDRGPARLPLIRAHPESASAAAASEWRRLLVRGNAEIPAPTPPPVPAASAPVVAAVPAPASEPRGVFGGDGAPLTLGPGDVLTLAVIGYPEMSSTLYVSELGRISVPLAGEVEVAGLSPAEAARRVERAYVDGEYLIDPQVNLLLAEFRSQQISVLGEVRAPGRFPIQTRITVLDGLALGGGVSEIGSDTVHVLRRRGASIARYEVDVAGLLRGGASTQNLELEPGDTVIVPRAEQFYIYGEVRSPNAYRLRPGTTVMQAISLGGGLTDRGSDRRIEIRRKLPGGGLRAFDARPGDPVQADDVVYVKERFF